MGLPVLVGFRQRSHFKDEIFFPFVLDQVVLDDFVQVLPWD